METLPYYKENTVIVKLENHRLSNRKYYQSHREQKKLYMEKYNQRLEVKERLRIRARKLYQNPEIIKKIKTYLQRPDVKKRRANVKKQYEAQPHIKERRKEVDREYKTKSYVRQRIASYRQKPEVKEQQRIYEKSYNKKPKSKERKKQYFFLRYTTDINFKLAHILRTRIYQALKNRKTIHTYSLVGCSIENLRCYLENQFDDGMSWKNYGKWHIDHIIPCASFDLTQEDEQKRAFHFSNLQPLWASKNLSKGARYEHV